MLLYHDRSPPWISATINMKSGHGNNEKFSARKRAMNYKASRKPPTTNPRIAHGISLIPEGGVATPPTPPPLATDLIIMSG